MSTVPEAMPMASAHCSGVVHSVPPPSSPVPQRLANLISRAESAAPAFATVALFGAALHVPPWLSASVICMSTRTASLRKPGQPTGVALLGSAPHWLLLVQSDSSATHMAACTTASVPPPPVPGTAFAVVCGSGWRLTRFVYV